MTVLAAEAITLWQFVGLLAFGVALAVMGWLLWIGRLWPDARYQTFNGAGAGAIPGGLGIVVITIGMGVRDALGKSEDWWLWWVFAVAGFALLMLGLLYLAAYFWLGVPDALRPRPQRGRPKPPGLLAGRRS